MVAAVVTGAACGDESEGADDSTDVAATAGSSASATTSTDTSTPSSDGATSTGDTTTGDTATMTTEVAGSGRSPVTDAFPVEIEHRHGTTTVEEPPERVVAVGLTDQDSAIALGVVPVGTTEWFGGHPGAVWPWAQDELGDAEPPTVVGDAAAINFEKIASLRPDLILGLYSSIKESDYQKLSQIAPTVAQPAGYVDYGIPWQEQTLTIGRALGRSAAAEALVAHVEQLFTDARKAHPEFEGKTAVVASPYNGISIYTPQDPRGRFLDLLGFEFPTEIADLDEGEFFVELSMEQAELIDRDAIVWIFDDIESNLQKLHDEPIYAALGLVTEAREVPVATEGPIGAATSFQTVLSIPALLDGVVPMLSAAVDGDPSTPVESPEL